MEAIENLTDEELLLEYREYGDHLAFTRLFHRYSGELLGYLMNRCFSGWGAARESAEDALQETFLRASTKANQFSQGKKLRPWLYAIATNAATDLKRRRMRHDRNVSLDGMCKDSRHPMEQLLDGDASDPEENAERTERIEQVRDAVDALPENEREVVKLVYIHGLKYREAAEEVSKRENRETPIGTIKSRLHSALKRLRAA